MSAEPLAQILFTQGFGTRRECAALIRNGRVEIAGATADEPKLMLDTAALEFKVDGQTWQFHDQALLMLNKPAGYECSQKPRHHPGVMSLLPAPLRTRGVQPVGRLDADTTGLLLFTDNGTLIHQLTSPKHHVVKIYEALCSEPVTPQQIDKLLSGVILEDDPIAVRAEQAEAVGEYQLRLTLMQGKYHQVKRMVAAAGNHVESLHRSGFGALRLPADLAEGQWCWVADASAAFGRTIGAA